MAGGSTLDPDNLPAGKDRKTEQGSGIRDLGPSDSSDSAQDLEGKEVGRDLGDADLDSDSDMSGTGEHMTAGKEPDVRANQDRDTDRVVGPEEAGLGGGLDEAEEARRRR